MTTNTTTSTTAMAVLTLLLCTFIFAGCVEDDNSPAATSTSESLSASELSDERLCVRSGGAWDDVACGHYVCGEPNLCRALIPGCDCGSDAVFIEGQGCQTSDRCEEPEVELSDQRLCVRTGGSWDEGSCGHYECGEMPLCRALIPGCDCGPRANFFEGDGCVVDRVCAQ